MGRSAPGLLSRVECFRSSVWGRKSFSAFWNGPQGSRGSRRVCGKWKYAPESIIVPTSPAMLETQTR